MPDSRLPSDRRGDDLARLYREAQGRLESAVTDALERGAEGTAAYRRRQLDLVVEILRDLRSKTPEAAARAVSGPYDAAAFAVDRVLGREAIAFGAVHHRAVEVLVENLTGRLDLAIATVGRRTEDAFRQATLREAAVGVVEGTTRKEVSKALRARIVREGVTDAVTGFVDKAGRRWSLEAYTRMAAQTTTREAQSAALANRLVEQGDDLITISDHRTETPICQAYEGETFSLTGKTAGYEVIDQLPPFHPGCWHVGTPAEATFDAWVEALRAGA